MSFLIQKPVLIAVRFMSITRNSVSVCINVAMCHSPFTLLSLTHPGVVLLCLSSMLIHPPCAAPVPVLLPDQPLLAFLFLSFFRTFIFLPLNHAWTIYIYNILIFPLSDKPLNGGFFFGWIIKRWLLKALSCQNNFCFLSFAFISLLHFIPWSTYCYFQHPPLLLMLICPFMSVTLVVSFQISKDGCYHLVFFRRTANSSEQMDGQVLDLNIIVS